MNLTGEQRKTILSAITPAGDTLGEDEQKRLWQWIDHLSDEYRNRTSATVDNSTLRDELMDVRSHVQALRAALEEVSTPAALRVATRLQQAMDALGIRSAPVASMLRQLEDVVNNAIEGVPEGTWGRYRKRELIQQLARLLQPMGITPDARQDGPLSVILRVIAPSQPKEAAEAIRDALR